MTYHPRRINGQTLKIRLAIIKTGNKKHFGKKKKLIRIFHRSIFVSEFLFVVRFFESFSCMSIFKSSIQFSKPKISSELKCFMFCKQKTWHIKSIKKLGRVNKKFLPYISHISFKYNLLVKKRKINLISTI